MTSNKQKQANKNNSLLSTGAKTKEGKATVARNAIKHGIFSKSLCLKDKECPNEHLQFHQKIIDSFKPKNSFQQFLAEKIAIDSWRLRRVLIFEVSSAKRNEQKVLEKHHKNSDPFRSVSPSVNPTNEELDQKLSQKTQVFERIKVFVQLLKSKKIPFDKPTFETGNFVFNLYEEMINALGYADDNFISEDQFYELEDTHPSFEDLRPFVKEVGLDDLQLTTYLLRHYQNEFEKIQAEIADLQKKKIFNSVVHSTCIIPAMEDVEKILRYERYLQKSIHQNTVLLTRLQVDLIQQ